MFSAQSFHKETHGERRSPVYRDKGGGSPNSQKGRDSPSNSNRKPNGIASRHADERLEANGVLGRSQFDQENAHLGDAIDAMSGVRPDQSGTTNPLNQEQHHLAAALAAVRHEMHHDEQTRAIERSGREEDACRKRVPRELCKGAPLGCPNHGFPAVLPVSCPFLVD
jgi:hypothetical protein